MQSEIKKFENAYLLQKWQAVIYPIKVTYCMTHLVARVRRMCQQRLEFAITFQAWLNTGLSSKLGFQTTSALVTHMKFPHRFIVLVQRPGNNNKLNEFNKIIAPLPSSCHRPSTQRQNFHLEFKKTRWYYNKMVEFMPIYLVYLSVYSATYRQ